MSIALQLALGLVIVLAVLVLMVHLYHQDPPHRPTAPAPEKPKPSPRQQPEDPRLRQYAAGQAAADPRTVYRAGESANVAAGAWSLADEATGDLGDDCGVNLQDLLRQRAQVRQNQNKWRELRQRELEREAEQARENQKKLIL